eukprot:3880186-Rhodomonas_salina.2
MRQAAAELVERAVGTEMAKNFEVDVVPKLGEHDPEWFEIRDGRSRGMCRRAQCPMSGPDAVYGASRGHLVKRDQRGVCGICAQLVPAILL